MELSIPTDFYDILLDYIKSLESIEKLHDLPLKTFLARIFPGFWQNSG